MDHSPTLSAGTVALRAMLVGASVLLILLLLGNEAMPWSAVIALWTSAVVGSCMMAWTRQGARRWAWAAAGTFLVLATAGFLMLTVAYVSVEEFQ